MGYAALWICGSSGWSCTNLSRASTWRLSSVSYRGLSWWTRRDSQPAWTCLQGRRLSRSATRPSGSRGRIRTCISGFRARPVGRYSTRDCLAEAAGFEPAGPERPARLAVELRRRWQRFQFGLPVRLEEEVGFEPTTPDRAPVFETGAFSRSATLPTGADDGTRTRSPPVDSRVFSLRTPSASGQLGRT